MAVVMGLLTAFGYGAAGIGESASTRTRRTLAALAVVAAWMTVTALVARSGALLHFDRVPPPMAFMIASVIGAALATGLSPIGMRFAAGYPLYLLVAVQAFRLPLEVIMHRAYAEGVMPIQLSYSGYNFDIVVGALAVPLAFWLWSSSRVPRWVVFTWNLWGWLSIVVIAIVAIAGSPMFKAFGEEPENVNSWVLYFPFVWLPTVLVVIAISGHIVIFRALRRAS